MKIAVFWGCRILTSQFAYEVSLRAVMPKLGVELVDLPEALCCGDPVKSISDIGANYLGIRALALAESTGLDEMLVPCNRCHFVISESKHLFDTDENMRSKLAELLAEEELEYSKRVKIWHTIDFIRDRLGLDCVKTAVINPLRDLKVLVHYGCQILRYGDLGRVDDAENPRKLDDLVEAIGARVVDYQEKLDCCGAHLMYSHVDTALSLAGQKLKTIHSLGADGLVLSCPDCAMMYDAKQKKAMTTVGANLSFPVLYYTQLLGLALGITQEKLGLNLNQSPVEQLLTKISA